MISRFTIGASGRQGSRTLISGLENRLSRAARPTVSGYLPEWTHRESNPDFQSAELVSSRWTMSPCSQGSGDRTHGLQLPRLADYRFPTPCKWTARESHPHFRLAGPAPFYWTSSPVLSVIQDGLEPSLAGCGPGVFAAGPRDHCSS